MLDAWIGDVVGRMRLAGISVRDLAAESKYSYTYVSEVLHGRKGDAGTKEKLLAALKALEERTATEVTQDVQSEDRPETDTESRS